MSAYDPKRTFVAASSRSRKLVKEEINGGNLAVLGDDEIGSGVSRRLGRAARHQRTRRRPRCSAPSSATTIGFEDPLARRHLDSRPIGS